MIVKMAKIGITGPRNLLRAVINLLGSIRVFQPEEVWTGFAREEHLPFIRPYEVSKEVRRERESLETIGRKVDELFSCLQGAPALPRSRNPLALRTISEVVDRHLRLCKDWAKKRETLARRREELNRYGPALDAMTAMLAGMGEAPGIGLLGFTLKDVEVLPHLDELMNDLTGGQFAIQGRFAGDGSYVTIVASTKEFIERVRETLDAEHIPEMRFPPELRDLPLPGKVDFLRREREEVDRELRRVSEKYEALSTKWRPLYRQAKDWIEERLALLSAQDIAHETERCFVLYGWVPKPELECLECRLERSFGGQVVTEVQEILPGEWGLVPIFLKNPVYFRPFELFTRLLPLPRYTSYDPTPFLAIFFPLFFGMILGDTGYGFVLLAAASMLKCRCRAVNRVRDAAEMLMISSVFAMAFGLLYGELFGDLGRRYCGLTAYLEREESILPMLYVAMGIGIFHVLFGLLLAVISALRRRAGRDALSRLLILLIIAAAAGSLTGILPGPWANFLLYLALIMLPALVVAGGFLAPIELMRSLGSILSYARLMAIGLASALLAVMANRMARLAGDIFIGLLIGLLFHAMNIFLAILSPVIQSVRLHYVEFFGTFIEHGGRKYEPLGSS